jgi:uncharacterized membrane protein YoaK (UPF0700 family)
MAFFQPRVEIERASLSVLSGWLFLLFLAGSVNAGGFLAAERFVTHITGFATLIGIDLAAGRLSHALGLFTVPLYFLLGSMISVVFVEGRALKGKLPRYDLIMLIICLCFFAVIIGGNLELFGPFGEVAKIQNDYFFLAFLCLASGLQNSAITRSSGSTIRTTHITGITTDLGLGFMKLIHLKKNSPEYLEERKTSFFRMASVFAFILGSAAGAFVFLKYQYNGFFLPLAMASIVCAGARKQYLVALKSKT